MLPGNTTEGTHLQPAILAGAHSPSSWHTAPALLPAFCWKLLLMPFRALLQAIAERFVLVQSELKLAAVTPWKSVRHLAQAGQGLSWQVPRGLQVSTPW